MTNEPKQETGILWHSNSPHSPTGYGNQTNLFAPLIHKEDGQRLTISAFYGRQGARAMNEYGIAEYPMYLDNYGNDIIDGHMFFSKSELVISLIDPFVLDPNTWSKLPWCSWVPVDCAPVQAENLHSLQAARWLWGMSKFGTEELKKALPNHKVTYVPHGVNTDVYKPIERDLARAQLSKVIGMDIQDKFVFICVAANKGTPSRKNFSGLLQAFSLVAQQNPDAILYIHTEPHGHRRGDNITAMVEAYKLEGRVFFPPLYQYALNMFPEVLLNEFYNAADAFILLSLGEGFGIPIVEAQAAGCPVIVTDGSAMSELCLTGWKVPAMPIQALDGRFGSQWWLASLPHSVEAMQKAIAEKDNLALREKARQNVLEYDYRKVYADYMKPAIAKMLDEINPKPVDLKAKRKKRKQRKKETYAMGTLDADEAYANVVEREKVDA